MKKTLTFIAALLCFYMANAQGLAGSSAVSETQDVQGEITEFPFEVLQNSMNASLAKSGRALGVINSDGSIYVIAKATSARASNLPGFIRSKNNAYNIAEMAAKMQILQMAGEQITSGRGYELLQNQVNGEDPDLSKEAQELLNSMEKQEVGRQDFNMKVSTLVSGMLQGCAVVRMAEGEMGNNDYEVEVGFYPWSEN